VRAGYIFEAGAIDKHILQYLTKSLQSGKGHPAFYEILKVRPSIAAGPHRVLTIEVWHQTSGCKGTNFLREVQVGFHPAPADKAGKALAAAIDGELFDQIEDDVDLIRGLAWRIS